MANIGDVTARLRADVSDYVTGMQKATQANQQLTSQVTQSNQRFMATEQQVLAAVAAYDRNMQAATGLRQAVSTLRADVEQATADFKAGVISVEDYKTALDQARSSAIALRQGGGLNPSEMSALNAVLVKTADSAGGSTRGLMGMQFALGSLAAESLGARNAVGRLAAGALFFSGGSLAALGILGGVAAIAFGYEALTKTAREAAAQIDKLEMSLSAQRRSAQGPGITAGQNIQVLRDEIRAANQDLIDTRILAQHERATSPFAASADSAEQRLTNAIVARHNAMVPLLDAGQQEIIRLQSEGFALTHTHDQVVAYTLALEGVPAKLVALAAATERTNATLAEQREGLAIATEIATLLPKITFELRGVAGFQLAPTNAAAGLDAMAQAADLAAAAIKELTDAREKFDAEVQAGLHPGGVVSATEGSQLRGLGIDPNQFQAQLDQAGQPLEKAVGTVRDKFQADMERTGRAGIEALLRGILSGTNDLLPLLQQTLINFLTSGISDVVGSFFSDAGGGGISSGGVTGAGAESGLRMSVHVGASKDPMSLARDGQWQAALRESIKVAQSQGFKVS